MEELYFIDLFSGAGGFTLGFELAGFKNIFSVDNDIDSCETYLTNFPNHKLICDDIKKLSEKEIKKLIKFKKIDVIIGGPPCQGFSMAGKYGRNFIDDPRNYLFKEFLRIVKIVKPKIFVMENVARLYSHDKGNTIKEIINCFEKIGYTVEARIICSVDYSVPQIRNRVIIIGNKLNKKNIFPKKQIKQISVKQAINDLPYLNSGKTSTITNHESMNHTKDMLYKMSFISDGGNREEIPYEIRPKTGDIRKYIKYDSSKPSICITGDMRKVFHYSQNRALTVRELARLQSFPDTFIFKGNKISQQQQVGNAVPPLMAKAIAIGIINMLRLKK